MAPHRALGHPPWLWMHGFASWIRVPADSLRMTLSKRRKSPPSLVGSLVRLRPVAPDDSMRLRLWRTNPALAANFLDQRPISHEQHEAWMVKIQSDANRAAWIVEQLADSQPVGFAQLMGIDWQARSAEWGFYLGETQSRMTGAGVDVELCVLRLAFDHFGLTTLTCRTLVQNRAVIRLHRRFGFLDEGEELAQAHQANGDAQAVAVLRQTIEPATFRDHEPAIVAELSWLATRLQEESRPIKDKRVS